MGISKETFIQAMEDMKQRDVYTEERNKFYRTHGVEGYLFEPDCVNTTAMVLTEAMNDDEGWIEYFCFEIEYGKKYSKEVCGCDISDAGKLYDFLVGGKSEDGE